MHARTLARSQIFSNWHWLHFADLLDECLLIGTLWQGEGAGRIGAQKEAEAAKALLQKTLAGLEEGAQPPRLAPADSGEPGLADPQPTAASNSSSGDMPC